ncbi:deSI-like protein At4g17486 [Ipomoea triloba]|uniref:deSI-like protein At4g17486 n=1 Tax=Ipomoea triloba TaxID=35885 RepID=UPI00125CF1CF|nr:deSI-like protein At4g17486 [Ipomoea triloba]
MPSKKRKKGAVPVYLNVYDLTHFNGYAYWFGLGIYHSGVQVHDVEYGFGAHERALSGIFQVEPKQCPGFRFRRSILIGRTDLCPNQVREFMDKLSKRYTGNSYKLITNNCNHFCNDVCTQLTGNSIPRWVNRLAYFGFWFNCVLPPGLSETKVERPRNNEDRIMYEKKLTRSIDSTSFASSNQNHFELICNNSQAASLNSASNLSTMTV